MEDQILISNSDFIPVPEKVERAVDVTGTYEIYELEPKGRDRKFVPISIVVTVSQEPEHIHLDLYNEIDRTRTQMNYPMKNVPCWSNEFNAFIFGRTIPNGFVADRVFPVGDGRIGRTTRRITWQVDAQARSHEIYEDFDSAGNRLSSSPGYSRILVPVSQV